MKAWIYRLIKSELINELKTLGIEIKGFFIQEILDDLHHRLSRFIDQYPEMFHIAADIPIQVIVSEPPLLPVLPLESDTSPAKIINQMWKWSLHFEEKDILPRAAGTGGVRVLGHISIAELVLPEFLKFDTRLW